jgi:hypothetical protein
VQLRLGTFHFADTAVNLPFVLVTSAYPDQLYDATCVVLALDAGRAKPSGAGRLGAAAWARSAFTAFSACP